MLRSSPAFRNNGVLSCGSGLHGTFVASIIAAQRNQVTPDAPTDEIRRWREEVATGSPRAGSTASIFCRFLSAVPASRSPLPAASRPDVPRTCWNSPSWSTVRRFQPAEAIALARAAHAISPQHELQRGGSHRELPERNLEHETTIPTIASPRADGDPHRQDGAGDRAGNAHRQRLRFAVSAELRVAESSTRHRRISTPACP